MKSLNYTLVIILSLLASAFNTNAQDIVGESDLFTFDTRLTLVSGTISEEGSGAAIQGANITFTGGDAFTTTSTNGSYSLDSVPAGNYNLFVFKVGYEEYSEDVVISGDPAQTINVSLTPGNGNYVQINDSLIAFADNIDSSNSVFTLSGNVHINNVLHFDGEIVIDKRPSLYNPEISGSCGFYATNIGNHSTYWIKNNNIAFEFEADDNHLIPTMWEYLLDGSFDIGGFDIIIGGIIIDPKFDFVEIVSIPKMPFPINKVMEYYNAMGNMDLFIEKMSGNVILSKTNGQQMAVDISDISVSIGIVEMKDVNIYFNTNTHTFGGAFTLKIPGNEPDKTSILFDEDIVQIPVEIRNERGQTTGNMSLDQFMKTYRGGGFKLELGAQIEFVDGAINKIIISVSTEIPLGTTGLELSQISGGFDDLATENWKIIANVDIDLKYKINDMSPVTFNDFGVIIQPWETFRGSGEFQVFEKPVSDGYIEYNRPLNALSAECNLSLGGIISGYTFMSLVGGQLNGSGLLSIHTPSKSKLKWYLRWAGNKNIGSAQTDFNNKYFQSQVRLGWIKLAHKLEFGKSSPPYFHYYLGKNLNKLKKVWKGSRDGKQEVAFRVPENAYQLLVVAMDTLNPTLFSISLRDSLGHIYTQEDAFHYEENDSVQQTIMSLLEPMPGEWSVITDYLDTIFVDVSILNQEPTYLIEEPEEKRTRSNQISLKINDYSDTMQVQVYYSTSPKRFNGTMIDQFRIINNGSLDFTWQNQDVPNGEYYIYCRIDDGYNTPFLQYAPGSIWVENDPGIETPQNLKVVQENEILVVNWDEPESDNIVAATVYYRNISSGRVMNETVYESTTAILKDLKPGQEYQLWICFITKNGAFSEASEKTNVIFMGVFKNNPPYFTLNADSIFIFVENRQNQYILKANDADGDALSFAIPNDTLGITLNNDQMTWTPEEGHRGGYDLLVTVTDGVNIDTTHLELVVYTEEQVSVDLAFSSLNLYEKDNMFVKIDNYFCPSPYQQVILKNTRTQEETSVETRRVNDFQYIGNFGLSYIKRSDIFVEKGDTIEAKYTYEDVEYFAHAYYDSLPQPSDNIPPGTISDLSIEQLMNNDINLKWTATGNDADSGKAYSYDIRYAYEPITTEDVYYTANRMLVFPYPAASGEQDSLIINLTELDGVLEHDNVYFSIKAADEMQNSGGLSNSPGLAYILNPANLTAVVENVYQIVLNWDGPVPGKQISGIQYYEVFRKIDQGEYSLLETGVVQTDYTNDLKSYPDGSYQYAIQANYGLDKSDTVYTPAVLMDRFANVNMMLSLQDTNNYQGISFEMSGLDDVYSQQFSQTTNSTGLLLFDNVFYGIYAVKASKENYSTLFDTISISNTNNSFDLELASSLGNIFDIPATSRQFFKIYPNPNDGIFTLELSDAKVLSDIRVEIYSSTGERVRQVKQLGQRLYEFDLSNLPRGIYLIRVIKGNEQGFMKLIRK